MPLDVTEAALLDALERALLTPAFVETVVRKVLTRSVPIGAAVEEPRTKITGQLAE